MTLKKNSTVLGKTTLWAKVITLILLLLLLAISIFYYFYLSVFPFSSSCLKFPSYLLH